LGLLTFWGYILVSGGQPGGREAGFPFCDRHRGYWPRPAWFIVGGFGALVGLLVAAGVLTQPPPPGQPGGAPWVCGGAGGWMRVFLPAFLVVPLTAMRPTGRGRDSVVLSGASREFAAAVSGGRDRV